LHVSTREAARYIESFNYFEHKSADAIKERIKDDPHAQAIDALTVIRPITAPVAANLLSSFGVRTTLLIIDVPILF
jgi:hypothetical protein